MTGQPNKAQTSPTFQTGKCNGTLAPAKPAQTNSHHKPPLSLGHNHNVSPNVGGARGADLHAHNCSGSREGAGRQSASGVPCHDLQVSSSMKFPNNGCSPVASRVLGPCCTLVPRYLSGPAWQKGTMATTVQAASHSLENSSWPLIGWLSILPIVLYGTFCSRMNRRSVRLVRAHSGRHDGRPPACGRSRGVHQLAAAWQSTPQRRR